MINAISYLMKNKGLAKGDKIGHIYHEGPYGQNALTGAKAAADKFGLVLVEQKIKPADADLTAPVTALKAAGVKAVLLTTSPGQAGNALQISEANGFAVPFVGSNPTFSGSLLTGPSKAAVEKRYLVVSSVAPFASTASGPTKVREGFKTAYPKDPKSAFVIYGYAQQEILAQTVEAACKKGDLTRAGLLTAFHSLGTKVETGGLLPTLDYSKSGGIPTRQTRVLKPNATIEGGLEVVQDLTADDFALEYQK
jgi:ABC-type branched-subunit amino acid transport system substrate-binding protein